MARRTILLLAFWLAAVSVGAASLKATNRFTIHNGDGQAKEFVKVWLGDAAVGGRSLRGLLSEDGDAPERWYILGAQIKSSTGGGYLAYDPEGKSNRVFLSREAGKGTDWTISLEHPAGVDPAIERGTIAAYWGPMSGWSLDIEEVKEKPKDGGEPVTVRRLVLSKKPRHPFVADRICQ
jgi:hypothetical protein